VEQIEAVTSCDFNPAEDRIVGNRHPASGCMEFGFGVPVREIRCPASGWIQIEHHKR
jgi:hypothetical protein